MEDLLAGHRDRGEHLPGFVRGTSLAVKEGGEDEKWVSIGVFNP